MRKVSAKKRVKETINPYELQRLRQVMRNKARLDALKISTTVNEFDSIVAAMRSTRACKNKDPQNSDTEYDPGNDSTSEGDKSNDDEAHSYKKTPSKTGNKSNLNQTYPAEISPSPPRKVFPKRKHAPAAAQQTTRITRSKTASTPQEAPENNIQECTHDTTQHAIQQQEDQVPLPNEEHTKKTAEDDAINQQHAQGAEDECALPDNEEEIEEEDRCVRGTNMGKGLQKITRARRGKLPLVIKEGKTRPVVPLIAAKFATESNVIVRNYLPVFNHWKEYKKQPLVLKQFMGGLKLKFDIDSNDGSVKHGCETMMKSAVRQQRYRLKKKYFKPFPLHLVPKTSPVKSIGDEQWNALVEHWKNPKNVETSEKNKNNYGQVKFHQATGSRSYEVHLENLGDKYKDEEPNAFDLFKDCHYSKKKGYTPAVQSAINELENKISESTDSQNEKPVNTVVAEFLAEKTKNNRFLQNVGLGKVQRTARAEKLEAQLAAEKSANAELQLLVSKQREQLDVLSMKFQESEQARINDKAETDKKLELLLSRLQSS